MAQKVIEIKGIPHKFSATGATPRKFRNHFKQDMMLKMVEISEKAEEIAKEEAAKRKAAKEAGIEYVESQQDSVAAIDMEFAENLAYIMCIDENKPNSVDEWLSQFDLMDGYTVVLEAFELWEENEITTTPPNEDGKNSKKKGMK